MFSTDFAKMFQKHCDLKGWPQFSADELLAMRDRLNMTEEDIKFIEAFILVWETFEVEYYDLLNGYKLDELSTQEIDALIRAGKFTEQDVIHFYRNEQWRDVI